MRNGWRWLAALFLCGLFVAQVYRAATQSITVDEARVFVDFIEPGAAALFTFYDAAHHVLQTYLSWLCVQWWGGSEFVLRIPALLACLAYFGFAVHFSARIFGRGPMFFLSVLLLAANPLILDHLALARGYGVALALFAWAISAALDGRLFTAGLLSGLSVAANLTFLVPACSLVLVMIAVTRRPERIWREWIGPGAIVCFVLIMLPVLSARPSHFYYGTGSVDKTFRSLAQASLDRLYWGEWIVYLGLAAGVAGLGAAGVGWVRGGRYPRVTAGTLGVALLATVAMNVALAIPFPYFRTGIWLVFLITTAGLAGGRVAADFYPRAGKAGAVLALVIGVVYLTQYDPRFAFEWRETLALKRYLRAIEHREADNRGSYEVSGDPVYKFPVEYYKTRLALAGMRNLALRWPHPGADYYIFSGSDRHQKARERNAALIADDAVCLCLLAGR